MVNKKRHVAAQRWQRAAGPGWLTIDHSRVRADLGAIYLASEQKFRFTASSISACHWIPEMNLGPEARSLTTDLSSMRFSFDLTASG
jgi:hypothetical protein